MQYGTFITKSAAETANLGEQIGITLVGGELILLVGDLGSGKTQITKGIAKGLGVTDTVISPTFTIERTYKGKHLELHHFDLYRTANDRELAEEINELLKHKQNIVVIEWPENIKTLSDKVHVEITFAELGDDERNIVVVEKGSPWS